jgi:hypothetical protein
MENLIAVIVAHAAQLMPEKYWALFGALVPFLAFARNVLRAVEKHCYELDIRLGDDPRWGWIGVSCGYLSEVARMLDVVLSWLPASTLIGSDRKVPR